MNTGYVLEVVLYDKEQNIEHVGYMMAKFKTKKDACSYYDIHNPHMRPLNVHKTYKSDWDPVTRLAYIVRKDYHLNANIPTFSPDEMPIDNRDEKRLGGQIYPWLK